MTRLRPIMIGGVVLVAALIAVLAVLLVRSQTQARQDTEKRFRDVATVSAALTDSIFELSVPQTASQAESRLGATHIDPGALEAVARRGQNPYVEVFNANGQLLGATRQAPRRATPPPWVTKALRTDMPVLSNALGGRVTEWAIPYQGADGRRVEVQGISPASLSLFLSGFLEKIPDFAKGRSAVIDGNGIVLGGPKQLGNVGKHFPDAVVLKDLSKESHGPYQAGGQGRYFAAAPVVYSPWHVLLTAQQSKLYASVNGSRRTIPWVIFGAFGLMALAGLVLLRRTVVATGELERKALSERHAVQINDNVIQGLALANYKLQAGQSEASAQQLAQTLREAQALVSQLLGEAELQPGQLRRATPAHTQADSDG